MASMSRTLGPAAWARAVSVATVSPTARATTENDSGEAWGQSGARHEERCYSGTEPRRPGSAWPRILGSRVFHAIAANGNSYLAADPVNGARERSDGDAGTKGRACDALCQRSRQRRCGALCCECGAVMPPLRGATQMRIRWFAELSHRLDPRRRRRRGRSRGRGSAAPSVTGDAQGDDAPGPGANRAQLRRRRHHWRRRLRRRRNGPRCLSELVEGGRARRRRSGAATPRAAGSRVHQRIDARGSAARPSATMSRTSTRSSASTTAPTPHSGRWSTAWSAQTPTLV